MSVLSTVLVYLLIPLAVVAIVVMLARAGSSAGRPTRRYRPGRPYDFAPTWFLSAPERTGPAAGAGTAPAIEAGVIEDSSGRPVRPGPVGGASDRW
ncbi:hypothetical protein [Actinoplanes sp. NPDC049265]|uniref:aa3-type cytochrome oxidase subunit CtaJ n=1 Tax=Actinoplanes sp. NPDC049265 TaxID=3363902 RepID=UPI00371B469C